MAPNPCIRRQSLHAAVTSKPQLETGTSRLHPFGSSYERQHDVEDDPERANYGGKTRRTSKIHWRKGRSTVTGHPVGYPISEDFRVKCPVPSNVSHRGPDLQ